MGVALCKRCLRTHDEHGRLDLDPFGFCQDCVDALRLEFEQDQLEAARIAGGWPEPHDLADQYPVGDS